MKQGELMAQTEAEYVWSNGKLVNWHEANMHFLTHALHYGSAVFEGVRCYETPKGPAVFRSKEHMQRLMNSAKAMHMDCEYSSEDFQKATRELIAKNNLKECYIRPLIYYAYGQMGLNPVGAKVEAAIAAWPWGAYLGEDGIKNGIRLQISPWRRHSPKAMPVEAKVSGAYVNSILAKVDAVKAGYDEALMLDENENVAEATGENIFIVKDSILKTPQRGNILVGITRDSIMQIAKDQNIKVEETTISKEDLYNADEAFLTGTAAEVTPMREVDKKPLGEGRPGPITKKLQSIYYEAIHGKLEQYEKWLDYVNP